VGRYYRRGLRTGSRGEVPMALEDGDLCARHGVARRYAEGISKEAQGHYRSRKGDEKKVLFIDEIHTVIGQSRLGGLSTPTLKPALSTEIRCIDDDAWRHRACSRRPCARAEVPEDRRSGRARQASNTSASRNTTRNSIRNIRPLKAAVGSANTSTGGPQGHRPDRRSGGGGSSSAGAVRRSQSRT
jgi:hypothetical protein